MKVFIILLLLSLLTNIETEAVVNCSKDAVLKKYEASLSLIVTQNDKIKDFLTHTLKQSHSLIRNSLDMILIYQKQLIKLSL